MDPEGSTIDPVCGRRIRPATAAVAAYDGHYHFCSMACREAFVADPRYYLQRSDLLRHPDPKGGSHA